MADYEAFSTLSRKCKWFATLLCLEESNEVVDSLVPDRVSFMEAPCLTTVEFWPPPKRSRGVRAVASTGVGPAVTDASMEDDIAADEALLRAVESDMAAESEEFPESSDPLADALAELLEE